LFSLLTLILSFNNSISYAQNPEAKRTNIWYFGNGAGLDFSSGIPVAITNSALHTFEGCASMCDINGNLLMYTDGDTIWDRNHQPMPNGVQLTGCPLLGSSAQASLIIPQPGNDSLYYVFTTDCWENFGAFGLRYNLVNINLNGGLGDVIPTQKNILLYSPSTEGLTATFNCDKSGVWIMSHEFNNNNYICYFLDRNGINPSPVISSIGGVYTDLVSYMRFSPNGKKFASYNYGGVSELFDFDNNTGNLTNHIPLPDGGYGTCFSNDNSKLYFTKGGNYIIQFNVNSSDVPNSLFLYYDSTIDNATFGAIENAPNGTILISSYFKDSISTIHFPNNDFLSANLNLFDVYLGGKQSARGGINDFIQNYFDTSPKNDCKEDVYIIPNTFSPNGDGINDGFNIIGLQIEEEVIIYNSWGIKLYEFSNTKDSWDGRTKAGVKCNEGVYFYIIKRENKENIKGFIHLFH
jgi:gliding motility-associated-like protein